MFCMGYSVNRLNVPGAWNFTQVVFYLLPFLNQELLGHIKKDWQIKMMAVFLFITHEKGYKFYAQL